MRIGIITIEQCNNYGAELQAYALQKKFRLMGYKAENINYYFYKHPLHKTTRLSKPIFRLSLKNRIKEWLLPKMNMIHSFVMSRQVNNLRRQNFDKFTSSYVCHSREYRTVDELYKEPPKYDVYVTGSDQVWNPRAGETIAPYLLDFVPDGKKRISYASSFGVRSLGNDEFHIIESYLKKYSAIGVRETSGVDIISRMNDVSEAVAVLDPTLLLNFDEWSKVSQSIRKNDDRYLLVYDLIESQELWELARKIANEKGLKIFRLCRGCGVKIIPEVNQFETAGPSEFIDLFANADFVVTNSFHGTAFSINFSKQFFFVRPRNMTNAGRVESILSLLSLNNRLIGFDKIDSVSSNEVIDFTIVQEKLSALRTESVNFIKNALEAE